MPIKSKAALEDETFEEIRLADSDFTAAPSEGETIEAGEVEEIARSEVEDDGQLSSYDMVQLGGELDPTGNSAKGKIFLELRNSEDEPVDDRTEVRFIGRPKNGNRRKALTEWYTIRDLARDDPRQRQPIPPVTNDGGAPMVVPSGRIIGVEVRNGAESFEVDLDNSTWQLPAQAGY